MSVSAAVGARWISVVLLSIIVVAGERDVVRGGERRRMCGSAYRTQLCSSQGCTN